MTGGQLNLYLIHGMWQHTISYQHRLNAPKLLFMQWIVGYRELGRSLCRRNPRKRRLYFSAMFEKETGLVSLFWHVQSLDAATHISHSTRTEENGKTLTKSSNLHQKLLSMNICFSGCKELMSWIEAFTETQWATSVYINTHRTRTCWFVSVFNNLTNEHIIRLVRSAFWGFSFRRYDEAECHFSSTAAGQKSKSEEWTNIRASKSVFFALLAASQWQDECLASHKTLQGELYSSSLYIYYSVFQGAQCVLSLRRLAFCYK